MTSIGQFLFIHSKNSLLSPSYKPDTVLSTGDARVNNKVENPTDLLSLSSHARGEEADKILIKNKACFPVYWKKNLDRQEKLELREELCISAQ
jgi:hypothetical protein